MLFQSFANEEDLIDVKDFEKILRTATGDELDPEEVKMVLKLTIIKKFTVHLFRF